MGSHYTPAGSRIGRRDWEIVYSLQNIQKSKAFSAPFCIREAFAVGYQASLRDHGGSFQHGEGPGAPCVPRLQTHSLATWSLVVGLRTYSALNIPGDMFAVYFASRPCRGWWHRTLQPPVERSTSKREFRRQRPRARQRPRPRRRPRRPPWLCS